MSKSAKVTLVVFVVLFLDQWLKFWIKLNFQIGESMELFGERGQLLFIENPGMAFGIELPGNLGKLLLSLFRIVAVGFLIYYIRLLARQGAKTGLLICFGLILAGALGNIIDSAFYGLIFSSSYHGVAEFLPEGGGYAGFLYGNVVDMFYFPLFRGNFPDWFPVWGGDPFVFFRPVFNLADAAISVGVVLLLLFHRDFFVEKPVPAPETSASATVTAPVDTVPDTTIPPASHS